MYLINRRLLPFCTYCGECIKGLNLKKKTTTTKQSRAWKSFQHLSLNEVVEMKQMYPWFVMPGVFSNVTMWTRKRGKLKWSIEVFSPRCIMGRHFQLFECNVETSKQIWPASLFISYTAPPSRLPWIQVDYRLQWQKGAWVFPIQLENRTYRFLRTCDHWQKKRYVSLQ